MRNVTREKSGRRRAQMRASRFFVLALLLIAISPGIALAGDVVVDGETKDFYSDDVIDNLTVINGGAALLWGTTVDGNIMVQGENSYLGLGSASVGGNVCLKDQGRASIGWSTISGNLQGDASGHINFAISEVVGNIQIAEGADFSAPYGPCKVGGDIKYEKASAVRLNWFTVGGNVQVSENVSPSQYFGIEIRNCKIDGDLQVFKNTMTAFIKVENNTVGGNLQVKENTPEPTVSGNDVEGNVELD